jgi:hypothetical protein
LFNFCTCYFRTDTAKLIGALFGAEASKVAHNNNNNNDNKSNNNNNNNNNRRVNKDLVSTLFWDFMCCVNSEKTAGLIYTAAEASVRKEMAAERGLYSTTGITRNDYYPKYITRQFETAHCSSWSVCCHAESSSTEYMKRTVRDF